MTFYFRRWSPFWKFDGLLEAVLALGVGQDHVQLLLSELTEQIWTIRMLVPSLQSAVLSMDTVTLR